MRMSVLLVVALCSVFALVPARADASDGFEWGNGSTTTTGGGTTSSGDSCGGNCPSGSCGSCPCGTTESIQDIASWCSQYSGWDQGCCQCIMKDESSGNANAMNYNTDSTFDVGLWQINEVNWPACNGGNAPCDPNQNLQCAINVYTNSGSWNPWSTCGGCGCC